MKLYYTPGACSLADHIALHEAGLTFEHEKLDLRAKTTETGADYAAINPKGYVPALVLDDGELLTENIAILDWTSQQSTALVPGGALGRTRLLGDYLFGDTFTPADCYLFVMLMWAKKNGVAVPDPLPAYADRVQARPAVQKALTHEGLA